MSLLGRLFPRPVPGPEKPKKTPEEYEAERKMEHDLWLARRDDEDKRYGGQGVCYNCIHFWMHNDPYARVGGRCHYNSGHNGDQFGFFVEYDSGCVQFQAREPGWRNMKYDNNRR